jgi:hypothetical protein
MHLQEHGDKHISKYKNASLKNSKTKFLLKADPTNDICITK